MTRAQFLNDLYHHLYGLTQEQAEQHLTYYAEMLADRMEEGMTEDEAVAGMEDVETIARRIMEEEGLPYTPPEQRPVTPPAYPDASKLSGGGGTRAYQAPRWMNRRRIAQIVLWTAAIAIAAGSVHHWLWRRNTDTLIFESNIPIDRAATTVEEVAPVTDYADRYDSYYEDIPYMEGYEYSGGATTCNGDISSIDIQWASGIVYIQSWSGDSVQVQEYANTELNERTAMSCQTDGGTLTIRYRENTGLGNVKDGKWLTVLVPDGMLKELNIETTSADVRLNSLELEKMKISTASGYITPEQCYTDKAELNTASGEMLLSGLYAKELDITTISGGIYADFYGKSIDAHSTSGDIYVSLYDEAEKAQLSSISGAVWVSAEDGAANSIGIETVSGDVSLSLPYEMGFRLDYSTISGDLWTSSGYELVRQGDRYISSGGGCEIEVETVSGDLEIY